MVTATRTKVSKKTKLRKKPAKVRTYDAALRYLYNQTNYEQMRRVRYNTETFDLSRMRDLLKRLKDPHKGILAVHIAGTKGKGSTATMLAAMLTACGHKVGLYTSPHICDLRERIRINGSMITQTALTKQIIKVQPIIESFTESKPTFFEIFTAVAFRYFADEKVDIAVIETGLGGRLDSTNVIEPAVVGITSISYDHMAQLGEKLADITREKAGIIKPDTPTISVKQAPEAEEVLRRVAKAANAPLQFTGQDISFSYRVESSRTAGCHARVCLTTPSSQFEHLPVPLLGEHQALNCGLALALLDKLKQKGIAIDDESAMKGLAGVYIPGRMEVIHENPRILVDGAHNGASIRALLRAAGQHIPYDSMVMIFGCGQDKDIDGMMSQIAGGADKVIFTRTNNNPRAADPKELAKKFESCCGRVSQVADTLPEALQIANNAISREDLICICGSFYLVGEAKKLMQKVKGKGKVKTKVKTKTKAKR